MIKRFLLGLVDVVEENHWLMRLRLYLRMICRCGAVERPELPEMTFG